MFPISQRCYLHSKVPVRKIICSAKQAMSSTVHKVRSTTASGSQVYESKRAVDEYLLFHYAKSTDLFPYQEFHLDFALNFTQRSAKLGVAALGAVKPPSSASNKYGRALDIGCAVGGLSFELTRHFEEVVGIDFSHHFVDAANEMKHKGKLPYDMLEQGTVFSSHEAIVQEEVNRQAVQFYQGDACNLDPSLGKFDLIVASNLLCRLPDPKKFLTDIRHFLTPDGVLLLISPYSWLEEYTPVENWIGARQSDAPSHEVCKAILTAQDMQLVCEENVPFLIREHARKFQLGVSHGNAWKLKK